MIKKKLTYILRTGACVALLGVTGACSDLLEENSFSNQNVNDFYASTGQAELALNGVYSTLWDYLYKDGYHVILGDVPSEIVMASINRSEFDLFSWTHSSSHLNSYWIAAYSGINRANTLMDLIQQSDIPAADQAKIVGQAKFLRGLFYFGLVKLFGGVPLHTTATLAVSDVAKERSPADEVYAFIEQDLTEAIATLGAYSATDHEAGRATSGAARALLAKVYLQQRKWEQAANQAKEVIDLGVYGLLNDYSLLWDPAHRNNAEQIFSVQNGGADNLPTSSDQNYRFFTVPRVTYQGRQIEFSLTGGGSRIEIEADYYANDPQTYRQYHAYRNTMPYYYELGSMVRVDDTVPLDRVYLVKFFHPNPATKELRSSVNTSVVRYADILLTFAEATNEWVGPTAEAVEAVNLVRRRARAVGTPHEQPESVYPDIAGSVSQAALRELILEERGREFMGEGERRNDLNRHDLLIERAETQLGITVKPGYELYPIPDIQRSLNPLLTQNPGYEG